MAKPRKAQVRRKTATKRVTKSAPKKKTTKRVVREEVTKKAIVTEGIEQVAEQQIALPKETKILNEQNLRGEIVKNQVKSKEKSKSTSDAFKRMLRVGIVSIVAGIVAKKIFNAWRSKRNRRCRSDARVSGPRVG